MDKGITGLDRAQLSRLVELVVGDEEVAGVPRILVHLQAVLATLMYLRTNASQEAIAEIMGVCRPTISRTVAVITRIISESWALCWIVPGVVEGVNPRKDEDYASTEGVIHGGLFVSLVGASAVSGENWVTTLDSHGEAADAI